MKNNSSLLTGLALSLSLSAPAFAEDFDVDDADSLDFDSFHQEKEGALKVWEKGDGFEISPKAKKVFADEPSGDKTTTAVKTKATAKPKAEKNNKGSRFEIRERYSLGKSSQTPYSAFYVIEAMHQQMASLCSNGWTKLNEFSVPVDGDYHLHYQFECR